MQGLTDTLTPDALSLADPHEAAHDPSGKTTPGMSARVVNAVAIEEQAARTTKGDFMMFCSKGLI